MNSNSFDKKPSDKLILQGIGFDLTPAIHEHVQEQAERLFRHEPTIERIEVFCERHDLKNASQIFRLSARIAVPGPDIKVETEHENLYVGVTSLSHKLDRQLRRRSRKLQNHRTRRVDLDAVSVD